METLVSSLNAKQMKLEEFFHSHSRLSLQTMSSEQKCRCPSQLLTLCFLTNQIYFPFFFPFFDNPMSRDNFLSAEIHISLMKLYLAFVQMVAQQDFLYSFKVIQTGPPVIQHSLCQRKNNIQSKCFCVLVIH